MALWINFLMLDTDRLVDVLQHFFIVLVLRKRPQLLSRLNLVFRAGVAFAKRRKIHILKILLIIVAAPLLLMTVHTDDRRKQKQKQNNCLVVHIKCDKLILV
jgi:hypothetical protein